MPVPSPRRFTLPAVLVAAALASTGLASHGPDSGHLPGLGGANVSAVAFLRLPGEAEDRLGDVVALGEHAFVGARATATCEDGGVHVVSLANPAAPVYAGFIETKGAHVLADLAAARLETPWFTGDVLAVPLEPCGSKKVGGFALYDVTDPAKPKKLGFGDGDQFVGAAKSSAPHRLSSVAVWQSGPRAFLAATDLEDSGSVDLFDITQPKKPLLLVEIDHAPLALDQPALGLDTTAARHATLRQEGDSSTLVVAYGDGGFASFDVSDPAWPVLLHDTDYAGADPALLENLGVFLTPEGNAGHAAFAAGGAYLLGADLDVAPFRIAFTIDGGPHAGEYRSAELAWALPVAALPDAKLNGPTVYGGYACPGEAAVPPPPPLALAPGEEMILVVQRGPEGDPSAWGDACSVADKLQSALAAGYDAVIVANDHAGAGHGVAPDAAPCDDAAPASVPPAAAVCIGHRAFHLLFGTADTYTYPEAAPAVGALGERASATPTFDGWGYLHLFDAATGEERDVYTVREAMEPAFALGYGAISARQVATHPTEPLAYVTWGSAGLRVVRFAEDELREVGLFIPPRGADFEGLHAWTHLGTTYALVTDRDSGLWVLQHTE